MIGKLKKYGLFRSIRIQTTIFIARIRGYLFRLVHRPAGNSSELRVYAGVKNLVRTTQLGNRVSIGPNCSFGGLGTITLCDNVVINRNCHFDAAEEIKIGPNTLIAPDCYIVDSNHLPIPGRILKSKEIAISPVTIGGNVWLGRGVTVLAGVSIGDHSVIGAGAVVTRDIPAGVVAVGVPARPIRRLRETSKTGSYFPKQ